MSQPISPPVQGPSPEFVKSLFGSIAHGYDRANNWITFGLAHAWRRELVRWSGVKSGDSVLDCACGTGDLSFEFKKAVGAQGKVEGSDFCEEMLNGATAKSLKLGLNVHFELADAMALPYPDHSFDVVSIAYGIRNVNDAQKALSEMARVCKPGGRVMVLETGDCQWPLMQSFYSLYFKHVVPVLGGLATGRKSAYQYLNSSSSCFPSRERFVELMQSTQRFASVDYKVLMGGASFIYRGTTAAEA